MFSANTDDQAASSDAVAGLAGDIGKLISNATGSDSYLVSQQGALANANSTREEELSDLAERMERVEERYNRQFLAMQQIIDQMNSTRESMESSFENLPFSKKPVCVVCIRIRWFLFMAVPLLLLMGTQTDLEPPEIPLHELVAQGIMFALIVVLSWRIYEYRQEKKAVARLLEAKAKRQQEQESQST
jgi:uncharacterized membrane protein YccC